METYPTTFATVWMHMDDGYQTGWGNQRWNYYGDVYIPNLWLDGVSHPYYNYNQYAASLSQRLAVPTDVTLELTGIEIGTQQYSVRARVCIEPGGTDKTMRVNMVHALDHWPTVSTWYRNCVRLVAAAADVSVTAGSCEDVSRTFTFDSVSWSRQADIKIVAWAQVPSASGPAEVHQAAEMKWPFPLPAEIFQGDFESGDFAGWTEVVP